MKALTLALRLAILICAALLIATLPYVALGLALALLAPLWFVVATVNVFVPVLDEISEIPECPYLCVLSPRPPPIS
jgi:hypothetical protein